MQEKIDWYQEVVDLEPSSKLFFPLAKMVAETDIPRAVDTLQRGLERHPEFIEARFYFVELLHKHSDKEDYAERLKTQLAVLSPMLTRYAGFWRAWSKSLTSEDGAHPDDKSLAVAFLGAMCEDSALTLSDIFAAGLQSLTSMPAGAMTNAAIQTPAPVEAPKQESEPEEKKEAPVAPKATPKPKIVLRASQPVHIAPPSAPAMVDIDEEDVEEEESVEQFSLRTRSMADVLAEQGDFAAAVAIYDELIQASESQEEKEDLQARVAALSSVPQQNTEASNVAVKTTSPGKDRVISVLESLADRLESRALS